MKKKIFGLLTAVLTLAAVGTAAYSSGTSESQKEEPVYAAQPTKLYLVPNANWKVDNARFAAYFFGAGEKWVSMTDENGDGTYEVVVPAGFPKIIFCRMNPSASANNWNNKWNQTADLSIPTDGKNLYTVKEGAWDKGGGTWSTFTEPPALGITGDLFLNINSWAADNVSYSAWVFAHTDSVGKGTGTDQWISFEPVDGSEYIQKITIPTEFNKGADLVIVRHKTGEDPDWYTKYNQSDNITSSATTGANYIEADGFDVSAPDKLKIKFEKVLDYAKVETWASSIKNTCSQPSDDEEVMTSAKWGEIEVSYNKLSEAEKFLVKDAEADESGSELQHALATYYHLVTNRGFNDFADRVDDSLETNRISILNDNSAIIIVISFVACFAFASLVIYRKRKHN